MSLPRYPEYKDSGESWLGHVPAHWEILALRRFIDLRSGEAITAEHINELGEYPVYGGGGLRGYTTSFTHDGEFAIIGRQGALCGNINYGIGRFWASEHAVVATPRMPLVTRWLGETLRMMNLNQYSVSAAQPGLSVDIVSRLKVGVPPLEEQHAIGLFIDRETAKIDALIAEQERLVALLAEKRQAVITQAVTKGLDPSVPMKDSGLEWLGEIPSHWEVARLRDLASMSSGHTPDKKVPEYWVNATTPWLSLKDTAEMRSAGHIRSTHTYVTEAGIANSSARIIAAGAVALCRDASVGDCAILDVPMAVSQHFISWECSRELLPHYLLAVFRCMRGEFERLSTGATIKTIGMPEIRALKVPAPPIDEQEAIVTYLAESAMTHSAMTTVALREIELLRERRAALISAAVTGQIDVRGLTDAEAA